MDKWLSRLQMIVVIIGLPLTALGLIFNALQTKIQAEALEDTRKVESANFLENASHYIDQNKDYDDLVAAIEGGASPHSSKYPLLKKSGGKFAPEDIETYINNYDDIGVLYKDSLVDKRMAYDIFSYSVEKTWCNKDVQYVISNLRTNEGDSSGPDAFYKDFENLAKSFFQMENKNKNCDSIENQ